MEYETNSRYSLYIQSDDNWHHDLTDLDGGDGKESIEARSRVVRQESKRLLETFRESLSAIFDCCETRKAAYVAQIKKIRDVSNLATRNAMQVEIVSIFFCMCMNIRARTHTSFIYTVQYSLVSLVSVRVLIECVYISNILFYYIESLRRSA